MSAAAMSEAVGRAERNKLDKRARLIRAARDLFTGRGFEATTTSEIAERADVGKGTLFFHAGSKEQLLVMMFQEDVGKAIERGFATVPDAPFIEQSMHVFGAMLTQVQSEPELSRIFARELAFVRGHRHGIDAVMENFFARMGALIERAHDRGEIARRIDPSLLAHNLFALYFSFMVLWLGSGAPTPQQQRPTLRQMIELALSGMSDAPRRSRPRAVAAAARRGR
jgi:AcrR family transcriptional regulator